MIIESLAIRNFVLSPVVIDVGLYSMSREKGFTMLVDWFQPPYIKKAKDFMLKIHLLKHY